MLVIRNFSETKYHSIEHQKADDKTNMIAAGGILGSVAGGLGYYGLRKNALGKSLASRNAKLLAAGGLAASSGYGYLNRRAHLKKYERREQR